MRNFLTVGFFPVLLLGACSEPEEEMVEEEVAEAPEVDLAGSTGAFLVTDAEGNRYLSYASAEGVSYSGPLAGDPWNWSSDGDQSCVDPGDEAEQICWTSSALGEDGTFTNTQADGTVSGPITPLATSADQQGGAWLLSNEDGTTGLAVWTADGKSYLAEVVERGTWHSVDGQRCGKRDSEEVESCGTPGDMAEDGTFTATSEDGSTITVQMLL